MPERVERREIVARPPEALSRERLSDEEMGNLISALGNHEAKALTLCLMTPGIIYSRRDLRRRVIQAQGLNIGWRVNWAIPFSYCENSLSPIGLVTREAINPDGSTYGYMKTEDGEIKGVPLAGLLLDFSLRHPDFSLQDFFGSTNSSSQLQEIGGVEYKERAPIRRLEISRRLLTSNLPMRTTDIANQIGVGREAGIGDHLFQLAERGFISYEAVKQGEAHVFYRLSEAPPSSESQPWRGREVLTNFVYQLLKEDGNREWSAEAIVEQCQQYRRANDNLLFGEKALKDRISTILSHLTKNGYARRRKFIGGKIQSEINLTREQREMLLDLVSLLDRFQNQDPAVLEFGRRRAREIIADVQRVSLLFAKAKEHSSNAGVLPRQETADEILRIISSHPDCTVDQIWQSFKEKRRKLSKAPVRNFIKALLIGRKITQTVERGVRHFNLAEQKPQ